MLSYLIQGFGWGVYAGVIPGPTQAFILSKTVKNGWRKTLPLAFVPLVSDLPIALLFCLLISSAPDNLLSAIQVLGGVYLLHLGIQTWKAAEHSEQIDSVQVQPSGFWQTVGINFTNPNVYIYWATIGAPIVLTGWEISPITGMSFIFGMYTLLIMTVGATIMLFGLTGKLPGKARFWIMRILALIVFSFGAYQILTGVQSLFI